MPAVITNPASPNGEAVESDRLSHAHRIASDQEALSVSRALAQKFAVGAAQRDRERILPRGELDEFGILE
jgi:hypothetical protein